MNSNDVVERFNELKQNNSLVCSEDELNNFMLCGLLFPSGNGYLDRSFKEVVVEVYKPTVFSFNLNLSNIISACNQISKENSIKRIYCMTQRCYNKYKSDGLIITKGDKEFYRLFESELWLVHII